MTEIIVLYDNRASGDLRPGWGFSALIRTEGSTVMLDTGADKMVLEHNARTLGIHLEAVAALALSHEHCDHIGAITSVLHRGLALYVPKAFAKRFSSMRRSESGVDVHVVAGPTDVAPGVRSIGQMGRAIPEQALLMDGVDGPVLITGCAHMGIAKLVRRATDLAGAPMSLVLGGFHLFRETKRDIDLVVAELLHLGVRGIGACHCTGDAGIDALRAAFGERFVELAAGTRLQI